MSLTNRTGNKFQLNSLGPRSICRLFLSFRSENNSVPSKGGNKKELQALEAFHNTKCASPLQPAEHVLILKM